ncbi:MAG: response regulator [Treponema sp.]|nr:response regulator [Treponema sp.]
MDSQMEEKKKLLVVDDDPLMVRTIRGWLAEEYNVSVVTSGKTALAFLKKFTPDLILLDYEMPVMSGPEFYKIAKEDQALAAIPIMFLTGKEDQKGLDEINSLKPEGCILKNRTPDEVRHTIAAFFQGQ